jgi:hypothetical protein
MRSDSTHFRSLNAAIAKMQSEDFQTMERSQETKRAERSGRSTGGEAARQERRSPKVFGKGGKVVAKSSSAFFKKNPRKRLETSSSYYDSKTGAMDESTDYTELLESVLLALCEELELDPNELLEDYQTPERAKQTDRLRMRARKTAQAAARKYEQAKAIEEYEKESPKTYGSKGRVVKPTKKMLKTRGASQKAQETKRVNAGKKYQEWDNARKETARKNLQTPQGRAIRAASIAQGQRNDLGW